MRVVQYSAVTGARVALMTLGLLALCARVPIVFGCSSIVVDGGSMHPALHRGDVVVACPSGPSGLRPGLVAVVADPGRPGELLTHRIVAVHGSRITLKGDANRQHDQQTVPRSSVRGIVRLVVPAIGLPAHWVVHHEWSRVAAASAALLALVAVAAAPAIATLLLPVSMRDRRARARRTAQAGAGAPP